MLEWDVERKMVGYFAIENKQLTLFFENRQLQLPIGSLSEVKCNGLRQNFAGFMMDECADLKHSLY